MRSQPEQIKKAALKFLNEKQIKFSVLEDPSFYTKESEGRKHPNDYWVVPYTYMVFQEEDAFVYVADTTQQVMYVLTNHGYIYPDQEQTVAETDEEDWDDL